jgi:cellulose synthase (UDP-forming)
MSRSEAASAAGDVIVLSEVRWIYAGLTCAFLGTSLFAVLSAVRAVSWRSDPGVFVASAVLGCIFLSDQAARWAVVWLMRRPGTPARIPPLRIAAVTAFVPSAEPLALLETALEAMVAMQLPHDTWVLDEGGDSEVQALCAKLGVHYFTRRHRPEFNQPQGKYAVASKHGNYNAWLTDTAFEKYDIVSAFDVDHVPDPNFLVETVGYFERREVGYVQSAQAYYNQAESFVARAAAEETYEFYSVVQMANYQAGYPTIIGCHNTHRVSALLSVGGFAAHDADDLLLTLQYRRFGWQGVYIPKILARGLAPADWNTYLVQQRRWARSVLDLKLKRQWAESKTLSLPARAAVLLHGLHYLQPVVTFSLAFFILIRLLLNPVSLSALAVPNVISGAALIAVLASMQAFRSRFYLDPQTERGIPWRTWIMRYAKWPMLATAVWDVVLKRSFGYVMTPKTRIDGRAQRNLLLAGHGLQTALLVVACCTVLLRGGGVAPAIVILAGLFVLFNAILIFCGWTVNNSSPGKTAALRGSFQSKQAEAEGTQS